MVLFLICGIPVLLSIPVFWLAGFFSSRKQKNQVKNGEITQLQLKEKVVVLNTVSRMMSVTMGKGDTSAIADFYMRKAKKEMKNK